MAKAARARPAATSAPHVLEVDITLDELAAILGDELQLPRIEPKGKANIQQDKVRYTSVRRIGPESLRHYRRTYVEALKRQLTEGTYRPADPRVVPIKDDRRYRSWEHVPEPVANAVIIYMMDVSGSMTDEQKEIVRTESFWIDTWLRSQYQGLERRYIIHDASAKEVDENTFYHTRESGGTRISSAYKVCQDLIDSQVRSGRVEHLLLPVLRRRQLGRRQPRRPGHAQGDSCSPSATCSATARSKAPTAAASSIACSKKPSAASTKRWCSRRLRTKRGFTIRSRSFWGKESSMAVVMPVI